MIGMLNTIIGLDCMNSCTNQLVIDRFQILLTFKNNIRCVFGLHDTPVITLLEMVEYRTILLGEGVQFFMDHLHG